MLRQNARLFRQIISHSFAFIKHSVSIDPLEDAKKKRAKRNARVFENYRRRIVSRALRFCAKCKKFRWNLSRARNMYGIYILDYVTRAVT